MVTFIKTFLNLEKIKKSRSIQHPSNIQFLRFWISYKAVKIIFGPFAVAVFALLYLLIIVIYSRCKDPFYSSITVKNKKDGHKCSELNISSGKRLFQPVSETLCF